MPCRATDRIPLMACLSIGLAIFLLQLSASRTDAAIANRLKYYRHVVNRQKHCGRKAIHFLRWACEDRTFNFPFPFWRSSLTSTHKLPNKQGGPYHWQAAKCCKHTCNTLEYNWICRVHHELKACRTKHPKHNQAARFECYTTSYKNNPLVSET